MKSSSSVLVLFDLDDTLFITTACVKVVDSTGNERARLSSSDYNTYSLKADEHFDYSEFRDADKFAAESIPNEKMLWLLQEYVCSGFDVRVLTARADFDCKHTFLTALEESGIPIDRIHIHRSGNLPTGTTVEKKITWVKRYVEHNDYKTIMMYDDSLQNLEAFVRLAEVYPTIRFIARHVTLCKDNIQYAQILPRF